MTIPAHIVWRCPSCGAVSQQRPGVRGVAHTCPANRSELVEFVRQPVHQQASQQPARSNQP